jgi:hypothetical protein
VVSSDHIDCDCGHFDYTCWAIQLHVRVVKLQDTVKFVEQRLGWHSRVVSVNNVTLTTFVLPLLSVCFYLAFGTVFQAFLTTFLFDYQVRVNWAVYQKKVSIFLFDIISEGHYVLVCFVGENSENLLCRLEDGLIFTTGLSIVVFQGDSLLRRVTEIIDLRVEAFLYIHCISLSFNMFKLRSMKVAIVRLLDGYYCFNVYHLQYVVYLILMGRCLGALCFMVELLFNRVFSKRNRKIYWVG